MDPANFLSPLLAGCCDPPISCPAVQPNMELLSDDDHWSESGSSSESEIGNDTVAKASSSAHENKNSKAREQDELDAIRSTYDIEARQGKAKLRREAKNEALEEALKTDRRYQGVKATRAEIFAAEESEEHSEEPEETDGLENQDDPQDSSHEQFSDAEEMQDDEDEDDEDEEDEAEDDEDEEDDENEEDDGDEDEGDDDEDEDDDDRYDVRARPASRPKARATGGITIADQAADEQLLIQSLQERKQADAAKGRAVRKQRKAYESALDLRIRTQKLVAGLGAIDVS